MNHKTPYSETVFTSEKWYLYWIGKSPHVHDAVEEYLKKYNTDDAITQNYSAMKHGVTNASIIRHITQLRKEGIIPIRRHVTKKFISKEWAIKHSIFLKDNKPYNNFYEKQKALGYVLCSDCIHVNKKYVGSGRCSLHPEKKISIESWRKCKQFKSCLDSFNERTNKVLEEDTEK